MKFIWVGLLLCAPALAWQGPRIEELNQKREPVSEWVFMGCRPTVSECRYSCPSTSDYAWDLRSEHCENNWQERVACFCRQPKED